MLSHQKRLLAFEKTAAALMIVLALGPLSLKSGAPEVAAAPQRADDLNDSTGGPVEPETEEWWQWRGPLGTGESQTADPPVTWGEDTHVQWRVPIPGLGHSSPIVVGDQVFITSAEPFGETFAPRYSDAEGAHDNAPVTQAHRFKALCYDRHSGALVWERDLMKSIPFDGAGHFTASLASASPVSDGTRVFFHFGSFGTWCLDRDGNTVWERQLGQLQVKHGHGEGASPALHAGILVINADHEGDSFVIALDGATGDELWRNPRDEPTSWSTPLIVEHEGRVQVIVPGTNRIRAYDLSDGSQIWECGGMSSNIVATPVAGDGMVFIGCSYEFRVMMGIRLTGAEGDITDTDNVVWQVRERTPYVPSPLLVDGSLYYLRHYQNIVTRLDSATGEEQIPPFRLSGLRDIYASPVAAAGRIYITDRDGTTMVISHAGDARNNPPRLLAANRLDDSISASLAVAGNQLFIRGEKFLYCIAESGD